MAIKGLTDRREAFPIIGTVRKGAPKAEGSNRPGADLKYFRYVAQPGEEESAEGFARVYGREPRLLNVLLPYRTADENMESWREEWVAGGLMHRCDGETCVLWRNHQTGEMARMPRPCPGGCKQVGRLQVILPDFERLALVVVMTTSLYDIISLTENLRALEAIRHDCRGIPLLLKRKPRRISVPEIDNDRNSPRYGKPTGKRVRREKWLLTLEAGHEWVSLQLEAMQIAALPDVGRGQRQIGPGGEIQPVPQISAHSRVLDLPVADDLDDEDDGEPQQPPAQPVPSNGNGHDNTVTDAEFHSIPNAAAEAMTAAEAVKARIISLVKSGNGYDREPSQSQIGLATGTLNKLAGGEDGRHAVMRFLFPHVGSLAELTNGTLSALIDAWAVKPADKDAKWAVSEQGKQDVADILRAVQLAQPSAA